MNERIVLPEKIYVLAGGGERFEQFHLYFRNAVVGLAADETVNVICDYGRQYRDFWRIEPGSEASPHYSIAQGEFPLRLQILDRDLELIAERETRIVIVPATELEPVRMLCIGDSITRGGGYVQHVQESLPWIRTVGTRTYDDGQVNREGRGGWTAENYLRRAGEPEGGDSPFLFPAGSETESGRSFYWGNANFWKRVLGENPRGYDYEGFQHAARDRRDATNPYRIGPDGYPFAPAVGDTICDPSRGSGASVCRWDGTEWKPMRPQPRWEFDFARYLERFGVELPQVVTFLFGANEFQISERTDESMDAYLGSIQRMIDAVHACDPAIRIVIHMPVAGADQDAWGRQLGCAGSAARYRRNMQEAGRAIMRRWDHEEARRRGIAVCPLLAVVDPDYGFDSSAEPVNKYVAATVERPIDWVHPGAAGHRQMGDALAATVQGIMSGL